MTRARDLAAGTFEQATGGVLKLETSDTTVTDGSVLGKIEFKAPDEASGTDAILVGAAIEAVAEGTFAADNNATELVFKTGASAAADAKMTLTSGGNLGIGTNAPVDSGTNFKALTLNGTKGGTVAFTRGTNSATKQWSIRTSDDDALRFEYGSSLGSEALRLDSSGNLLVGAAASESGIPKAFIEYSSQSQYGLELHDNSIGTNATQIAFYKQTALKGSITSNSSSTSFNTSSDYRLKTDAQPMTGASARVLALNPVNFEWIADGTRVDGFLAHEAQAVVPEAVTGTKDAMMDEKYEVTPAVVDADGNETTPAVMGTRSVPDMQGIDQSKMVPLLVAALQEALARITALEG